MNRSIFVLVAILLLGAVFLISPAQIPVIIFKASLVSLAAILGYWIDYLAWLIRLRQIQLSGHRLQSEGQ